MAGTVEERWLCRMGAQVSLDLASALSEYRLAAEEFARGLDRSSSEYELMVVEQRYLISVSNLLKKTYEIFDYQEGSQAASLFEAAAWSYLDGKDLSAYIQGLDDRFSLSSEDARFVRSRLKTIARRANRISKIYSRDFWDSANLERSAWKFLLDVFLELPVGAWEFVPCLAINGNCRSCGYARDHGICAQTGSACEMLSSSRESILKCIRKILSRMNRSSESNGKEQKAQIEGFAKLVFTRIESDICGEYEVVEACD